MMTNNVCLRVTIKFKVKRITQHNSNRKDKTLVYEQPMIINLSKIKPYSKKIKIFKDDNRELLSFSLKDLNSTSKNINNEIILDSNINIWRQLYTEKILKFIEEKNYTSAFSRKILHDNYKTLNLIYENMGHELIKNKMISYYEPTKKRIFNGKFLNSIIQNNQTIFW